MNLRYDLLENKKELILIFSFYLLVALSSIINLGYLGKFAFFILLVENSRYSSRAGAIVLLSMFYLPVAGLGIPNVFVIATIIVAIINYKYIRWRFRKPIIGWILKFYSLFLVFRFLSIISANDMTKFWTYIFVSFSVLIHIVVFSHLICKKEDLCAVLKWWGIIGALSSILGFVHFVYSDSVYLRQIFEFDNMYDKATIDGSLELVRWIWVGAEPNFTGLQLLIPFTINLGFLFKKFTVLNTILFAITLLGVLGTYSRTSFLVALIVIVLFVLLSKSKYRYFAICMLPLAFFAVVTYFPEFVDRINTIQEAAINNQGSGRFPLYLESINNFFSNPIIGIGTGQTALVSSFKHETHNLFLQTLGENGIFGFIFLLILFGKSFSQTISLRKIEPYFFIGLLAVTLNCNTVSAFDMRIILSFVIIVSYFYYYTRNQNI